jgi:hypothetical protein
MQAEVIVLAGSRDEALDLLKDDDKWNIEELKRIEPLAMDVEQPRIVYKQIFYG